MLMKTTGQTVSIAHQNVATWHYEIAFQFWDIYSHCLDGKGLLHPDFVTTAKNALSEFMRHTLIADTLMRRIAGVVSFGQPKTQTHGFGYQFEQAVAQRGRDAKAEFEAKRKK